MTDEAPKITFKGRGEKRAIAADNRVVALDAKLAKAKAAHMKPVAGAARSQVDGIKARADLKRLKIRLGGGKRKTKLANANSMTVSNGLQDRPRPQRKFYVS